MLDDVEQQHVVELTQVDVGERLALVPQNEPLERLRPGGRELIDPGDAAALPRELLGEEPGAAADVDDTRPGRHRFEGQRVR